MVTSFNGAVVLHDGQVFPRARDEDEDLMGFNGAVVLHDGQAAASRSSNRGRGRFNGAVVLHDGQVRRS